MRSHPAHPEAELDLFQRLLEPRTVFILPGGYPRAAPLRPPSDSNVQDNEASKWRNFPRAFIEQRSTPPSRVLRSDSPVQRCQHPNAVKMFFQPIGNVDLSSIIGSELRYPVQLHRAPGPHHR